MTELVAVRQMAREGRSMLVCHGLGLPHVEVRARAARALQRRTGLTINVVDKRYMEREWIETFAKLGITDWWFTTPQMICNAARRGELETVLDATSINVVDFGLFKSDSQFRRHTAFIFRSCECLLGKLAGPQLLTVSGQQAMRVVYPDWPRSAWYFLEAVMQSYGHRTFIKSVHLTADADKRHEFERMLATRPALRAS